MTRYRWVTARKAEGFPTTLCCDVAAVSRRTQGANEGGDGDVRSLQQPIFETIYLEGWALWWFGAWVSCGRHVADGVGDAVVAPVA